MSTTDQGCLFDGSLPTSTTIYVPVPVRNGAVGAFISWPDATSSATITLELTSRKGEGSSGNYWKDSGVSVTGPAGSALGSSLVNVENVRQKRARLKIVTAAVTYLEIWDGTLP